MTRQRSVPGPDLLDPNAIEVLALLLDGREVSSSEFPSGLWHDISTQLGNTPVDARKSVLEVWLRSNDQLDGHSSDVLAEIFAIDPESVANARRSFTAADVAKTLPSITWLWPGWLPNGFVAMVAGYTGVGKSHLALSLAAAALGMSEWPDGTQPEWSDRPVMWVETESAQAILINRIQRWGLPAGRFFVAANYDHATRGALPLDLRLDSAQGWAWLERDVRRHKPTMIIIDSWRLAQGSDENKAEGLPLLHRLSAFAREHDLVIVVVHHLNKRLPGTDGNRIDLERVSGHNALTQLTRVVMWLDRPDDASPTLRLAQAKNNFAPLGDHVGVTITNTGLEFGDPPKASASTTQSERARELLARLLADGPVPEPDVEAVFQGAGISMSTAKRAKSALGIESRKRGESWMWGFEFEADQRGVV